MVRKIIFAFLVFTFHFSLSAQVLQINTSADILLQLKKMKILGSVLYIAAHPDDENNSLLPFLAKEKLYRTGYLSLTRGDGGQNLIGSEQGIELGMIRTQELLAARRIDGAEQYFSTAYEFGFSKNADEALHVWDKQKILSDVVWVIRQFQPDIIITRFPQDARAGHGHHWASAIIANEAFKAAADPNQFPEQLKYGVQPWQAKRILWNTFNFGGTNTTSNDQLKIETGIFNPLLGESYGEIGGDARSMHKSQGTGSARRKGSLMEYFVTTGGDAPKSDLMDGIMIDWNRVGGSSIENNINQIISAFNLEHPELSVSALVKVYQSVQQLKPSVWREKKLNDVQHVIELCAGFYADATATQQSIAQGDNLRVTLFLNNRKNSNIILKRVQLENFDSSLNTILSANQNFSFNKNIPVADNKPISQPYWLVNPTTEGMFNVTDYKLIGKAENDPSFEVNYTVNIEGVDFLVKRPVQYKYVDAAKGELFEPIAVLPKIEMNYLKDNYVSMNGALIKTDIHFKSNSKDSVVYSIDQSYPNQWKNNSTSIQFIASANKENYTSSIFSSTTKETNIAGELKLSSNDKKFDSYTKVISYDHIPTITYFPKAKTNLVKVDIKTVGKKIGYIIGAGDKVPEALLQLGYEVKYINEEDLNEENLKQFDAIIVGIRAYNLYEYLSNKNQVLNQYVAGGGNLIVQYMKSNQVGLKRIKAGPFSFSINAGLRVTEEDTKVNFLLPDHPVFNYPNKITQKDFDGWVQERSTYQAEQVDVHYEALIGMNDKNEKESNGSLIIAKYGKGNFVYLSLVMFRQLPAGVPGAYRLMANLIALPKNK
jgi:LmbE family N-acetylglucosaminyl deacetylase